MGAGNVFYEAVLRLDFKEWLLSDLDTEFFEALLTVDLNTLPLSVNKLEYKLLAKSRSPIAKLIEKRITFAGKGWSAGFAGETSNQVYNGLVYRRICQRARTLLQRATISSRSWDEVDYASLSSEDFVYLDPPYYGTKAPYPNIDHEALVATLNTVRCKWALSGYANEVYATQLKYRSLYVCERNSEIKSVNTRKYEPVIEHLWTNY